MSELAGRDDSIESPSTKPVSRREICLRDGLPYRTMNPWILTLAGCSIGSKREGVKNYEEDYYA